MNFRNHKARPHAQPTQHHIITFSAGPLQEHYIPIRGTRSECEAEAPRLFPGQPVGIYSLRELPSLKSSQALSKLSLAQALELMEARYA